MIRKALLTVQRQTHRRDADATSAFDAAELIEKVFDILAGHGGELHKVKILLKTARFKIDAAIFEKLEET